MRKTRMANVLFLICVMAGFLAGCHKQAAPVEVRELAQEEAVPKLTLTPGQKEPQIVGRWSTDGLNVTYVTFPGIYQSLGDGVFYSYPDENYYGNGAYYAYNCTSDTITQIEVQMIEEMTSAGQVRFRWWIQDNALRLHNISDQQLKNDYTLDAPLAYAAAIQGDTTRVLLKRGGGTEQVSFYLMNLDTKAVEPLSTGMEGALLDAVWNSTATRVLLRADDRTFYLGDGSQSISLQELTKIEPPIVEAYWQGADNPEQLICISQENDGKLSAWRYDCSAQTAALLLEDYEEYQGSSHETTQYLLLSEAYALRCDPDGTTYLLDLSQKSERVFSDFFWKTGVFSECSRDTASYIAREEQGITSLGYLNCSTGTFRWFHRVPHPDQAELFDPLRLDDHVLGIAAQLPDMPDAPRLLYVYHFSE